MCQFQVVLTVESLFTLNEIKTIRVPNLEPVMTPFEAIEPLYRNVAPDLVI